MKHINIIHIIAIFALILLNISLFRATYDVDLDAVLSQAKPFSEDLNEGELFYYFGNLSSIQTSTDNLLKEEDYIYIYRNSKMYSYKEEERWPRGVNYELDWVSDPLTRDDFNGAIPPEITYEILLTNLFLQRFPRPLKFIASDMYIDDYYLNHPIQVDMRAIPLDESIIEVDAHNRIISDTLLIGRNEYSTLANPRFGDIKVQYQTVENNTSGLFIATLENGEFVPYRVNHQISIFHFYPNMSSIDEVLTEHTITYHQEPSYYFRIYLFAAIFAVLMFLPYYQHNYETTKFLIVSGVVTIASLIVIMLFIRFSAPPWIVLLLANCVYLYLTALSVHKTKVLEHKKALRTAQSNLNSSHHE